MMRAALSLLLLVPCLLGGRPPVVARNAAVGDNLYNVLFIAIDDLRPELGCFGAAYAQTPHLDRFAVDGVRFLRHYAQVPTCGASRYALLTGRDPARSGITGGNQSFYRGPAALAAGPLDTARTMPELFRRSGYRTTCIGKISHTPDGRVFEYDGSGDGRDELPDAWDELATPLGEWGRGWGTFFAYRGGRHREDGQGHRDLMEFTATADEELPDGMMAREAIGRLRAAKERGERFFLGVGFFKPHLPFVATAADWEAFADVEIPPPAAPARLPSPHWSKSGEFYGYDAPFEKSRPLATDAQRMARRAYLACVRYVDRQVGKVLDALDELGLAEDTIVVIWGDHGWHLGEQEVWGKHTPYERALRSVLMMRVPGAAAGGQATEALVESIDIYPTLIDLCQPRFRATQHPPDGKSLRPLLTGEAETVREAALSHWGKAVSVRTATHRLIATVNDGEMTGAELYDAAMDEAEGRNIAEQEPQRVAEMARYLPPPR